MSRRITEVHLLAGVPLTNDYKNTIYFDSKESQTQYFLSKSKFNEDDFSYQRKDKIIKYPVDYDDLVGVNYVMYKNSDYSSKWYYAFVTKIEYVNDGMSAIHIDTDVLQTWLFDYTVRSSFVEREHVSNDSVGIHTVPEGLETGEYIVNSRNANESLLEPCIIIGTTVDISTDAFSPIAGHKYNNVFSGVKYYKMTAGDLKKTIERLAEAGKSDSIVSIFTAPKKYISCSERISSIGVFEGYDGIEVCDSSTKADFGNWVEMGGEDEEPLKKPTSLNGYTPKNKKLLTYPYCYMSMSNNAGSNAIYRYELFDDSTKCDFRVYSSLTPGMSIRLVPLNYNGASKNNDEGLNLGKFPICAWTTDVYTNWLTQNGVNIATNVLSGLATTGLGAVAMTTGVGAVAGGTMVAGGVSQIAGSLGEVYSHSKVPPQVEGNVNSGDVTFSSGYLTFCAYNMSIRKEYAQIIDRYFDMYGYKVNYRHIPNKNHRKSYWYTKTIDANITGNIPVQDLSVIKAVYDNGVTFWKNDVTVGNYEADNSII